MMQTLDNLPDIISGGLHSLLDYLVVIHHLKFPSECVCKSYVVVDFKLLDDGKATHLTSAGGIFELLAADLVTDDSS